MQYYSSKLFDAFFYSCNKQLKGLSSHIFFDAMRYFNIRARSIAVAAAVLGYLVHYFLKEIFVKEGEKHAGPAPAVT